MSLIVGMDIGVFLAWFGTILMAILCVAYGIYYEYFKEPAKKKLTSKKPEKTKKEEVKK